MWRVGLCAGEAGCGGRGGRLGEADAPQERVDWRGVSVWVVQHNRGGLGAAGGEHHQLRSA